MADITNKDITVPGVNSWTTFVKQKSLLLDFSALSAISAVGTHSLCEFPDGEALVGLRVFAITGATSGGAATAQFKWEVGGTVTTINSTAFALSGLAEGMVQNVVATSGKLLGKGTLQLTVGTAAYTGGKLLVIVETVPAKMFVTNG